MALALFESNLFVLANPNAFLFWYFILKPPRLTAAVPVQSMDLPRIRAASI